MREEFGSWRYSLVYEIKGEELSENGMRNYNGCPKVFIVLMHTLYKKNMFFALKYRHKTQYVMNTLYINKVGRTLQISIELK